MKRLHLAYLIMALLAAASLAACLTVAAPRQASISAAPSPLHAGGSASGSAIDAKRRVRCPHLLAGCLLKTCFRQCIRKLTV